MHKTRNMKKSLQKGNMIMSQTKNKLKHRSVRSVTAFALLFHFIFLSEIEYNILVTDLLLIQVFW